MINIMKKIKNIIVYPNNCREDVLSGLQLQRKHVEYSIGKTLFATSDKGKKRDNQEDSVLIMTHPNNENINLIAVADGAGGHDAGELASNYTLKAIIDWFENQENFDDTIKTMDSLRKMLKTVLKDADIHHWAATTLSLALIMEQNTLIANIGDSRVYTVKDGKLERETRDDSITQEYLENGMLLDETLQRFHHDNNQITLAISNDGVYNSVGYKIIKNDYDKILAVTDGVIDCLSEAQLEEIVKKAKNEELTNEIVSFALNNDSNIYAEIALLPKERQYSIKELKDILEDYYKTIPGGKDNTTAAAYIKK